MPTPKRAIEEVDALNDFAHTDVDPLLSRIRNLWEFACLMQYIYIFGDVLKISKDVDIETLEMECCKSSHSEMLSQIGLALLKFVSSHRGLTPDLFDEYTRRQYDSKAPARPNPFGHDEEPLKFADFDIVTRIRILHQLSVWTMNNPDRIRQTLAEEDTTSWRIEPLGWDRHDRTYFLLDDNRLYRKTDPVVQEPKKPAPKPKRKPPPPPPPKPKGSRSSKRQKLANGLAADSDQEEAMRMDEQTTQTSTAVDAGTGEDDDDDEKDNGLGGAKWECIAITLGEYQDFVAGIKSTRDENEKVLRERLIKETFPVIEKLAADQERKAAQKRREFDNMQRLALAKRSSRIADRAEKLKEQREAEEVERKHKEELTMARKEQDRQRKLEEARESRMITREQRLKDREMRRVLSEQQLAELESQSQSGAENLDSRMSERHRKQQLESKRRELEEIAKTDEEWYFDCSICGVHGKNLDDGTHIIACEKCDVWQHSECHGIKADDAEREDFHFICATCQNPRPVNTDSKDKTEPPKETPVKKKRGRKPKALTESAEQPAQKKQRQKKIKGDDKSPEERKKRPRKKKSDQPHTQVNGVGPSHYDTQGQLAPNPHFSANAPTVLGNTAVSNNFYLPRPGHFYPPTNGTAPPPNDHIFFNYNQGSYSPLSGQQRYIPQSPTRPSHSPPQSQANGVPLSNASNVTWHHTQTGNYQRDPSQNSHQPSSHNPYINEFARQRASPYTESNSQQQASSLARLQLSSHQTLAPSYRTSPPSGTFATARPAVNHDQHPDHQQQQPANQIRLPPIAPSPTPSLSATQGNTAVRFSPSQTPHTNYASSNLTSNSAAHSYSPASNAPTASGVSPIKQSTSAALPLPGSTNHPSSQELARGPPIPKFDSPPQQSAAGISPVKHDLPLVASPPQSNSGLGIASASNATVTPPLGPNPDRNSTISLYGSNSNTPNTQPSKPPSSMQNLLNSDEPADPKPSAVLSAPVLSPRVELSKGSEPAPKKSPTSPQLPPALAGPDQQIPASALAEPLKSPNPTRDNVELPPIREDAKPDPDPVKSPAMQLPETPPPSSLQ